MKRKGTEIIVLILSIFLASCQSSPEERIQIKVNHFGALKDIMHKGDVSAKADLSDLRKENHIYAIGACENLKGEILILDSNPYISRVENDESVIDQSFNSKAALLVYAKVASWKSVSIPENIKSYSELERFVAESAFKSNIDTNEAFPFMISGIAHGLSYHIIDWEEGDSVHTHEKHVKSGIHASMLRPEVDVLGFYSNKHHRIFTHHSTNIHAHMRTTDGQIAAHLDDMVLGEGMKLMIPQKN